MKVHSSALALFLSAASMDVSADRILKGVVAPKAPKTPKPAKGCKGKKCTSTANPTAAPTSACLAQSQPCNPSGGTAVSGIF
jgi:hypothetical protein